MGIMFLNFLDVDNYDAEASEEDDTIDGSDSEGEELKKNTMRLMMRIQMM